MAQAKISGVGVAGWVVAAILGLIAIGRCSPQSSMPASAPSASISVNRAVAVRSLKCRLAPSANARVVRSYTRNDPLPVAEEANGWARVTGAPDCWVASRFLSGAGSMPVAQGLVGTAAGAATGAGQPAAVSDANSNVGSSRAVRSRTSHSSGVQSWQWPKPKKKRRSSGGGFDSGCPCSGRLVCIGPRGGRYCITSGGNKRYGV